jgi:DNA polymerase-1
MIYLVSKNKRLYSPEKYQQIPFEEAMQILQPLKEVQIDTETLGLDCHTKALLTLQLGCTDNQIVFDWTTITKEEKQIIKEYLESDRLFIGHNLMFDLTFLYKQDIWPNYIYDTMIGEQLIYLGYPRKLNKNLMYELGLNLPAYELVEKKELVKGINVDKSVYELSYSLKSTAKRRINIDIDKTVRGKIINEGLTEDVVVYAGGDVMWLEKIKEAQLKELAVQELLKAMEFECEFVKSLAYVKYCGVHLDVTKWKDKMRSDQQKLDEALNALNQYVLDLDNSEYIYRYATSKKDLERIISLGFTRCPEKDTDKECWKYKIKGLFTYTNLQHSLFEEYEDSGLKCNINWSSSSQVIKLFELLGIQVKTFDKKTKKEKKSIEEKLIAPQAKDFPIISIFLKYQAAAKLVSTYGQNWLNAINPNTGRIHAELHSIGTDTSRVSSGGGPYKLNQQNLPHDAITRACFTAEKGNKWISCDYQSQESRIIASVSQDQAMIDLFETGCGDVHSLVAYMSYPDIIPRDTKIEDIKKLYHTQRQEAKGIEFAVNYGGDANTIANNKGIPIKEAEKIYKDFMKGFPGVAKYQEYCRKNVSEKGYILMNSRLKHRAHVFDAEWQFRMQTKFKDPEFWRYYNEMKRESPNCDTVQEVQKYFKRKSECEKEAINYRMK